MDCSPPSQPPTIMIKQITTTPYGNPPATTCTNHLLPFPENVPPAILHNIFIKGDQMSFRLTEDDLEASKLYPDYKYTSVNDLLDICLVNPPKPKLASFS
ncbi:hypothetical protein Vadar_014363 [Vaccinium darrowii]|uniref:Uncharacterized protein n=1 Tax=Vaccinium darrowii TaxID=229202 RepID=A0ACB7X0R4_9ERIC|nr:hypothetical protein Vadar_014363 [Vaccinium darrowii]